MSGEVSSQLVYLPVLFHKTTKTTQNGTANIAINQLKLLPISKPPELLLSMHKKPPMFGEVSSQSVSLLALFLRMMSRRTTQNMLMSITRQQWLLQMPNKLLESHLLINKLHLMLGEVLSQQVFLPELLLKIAKTIQTGMENTALHQLKLLPISKPLELLLLINKKPPMSGEVSSQLVSSTEHSLRMKKRSMTPNTLMR